MGEGDVAQNSYRISWLVNGGYYTGLVADPSSAAANLGMPLLTFGRSTQVGDFAAFLQP